MAYPYGTPSSTVSGIYSGTSFTPGSTTSTVRDNYTSIDKASLTNSLGIQMALVQNFVNSTYLARSDVPIGSGWINYLFSDALGSSSEPIGSGYFYTMTSEYLGALGSPIGTGYFDTLCLSGVGGGISNTITDSQVYLTTVASPPTYSVLSPSSLYFSTFGASSRFKANEAYIDTPNGKTEIGPGSLLMSGYGSHQSQWISMDYSSILLTSGTFPVAQLTIDPTKIYFGASSSWFELDPYNFIQDDTGGRTTMTPASILLSGFATNMTTRIDYSSGVFRQLYCTALPTGDTGTPHELWNSGGYVCIV